MNFCTKCGNQLMVATKFCVECGSEVSEAPNLSTKDISADAVNSAPMSERSSSPVSAHDRDYMEAVSSGNRDHVFPDKHTTARSASATFTAGNVKHEEALQIFIGQNYDYYRKQWDRIKRKQLSFNWASFFSYGVGWFSYRKMYTVSMIYIIGSILLFLTPLLIINSHPTASLYLYSIFALTIFCAPGFFGNYIYKLFCEKKIRSILKNKAFADVASSLAAQGGVNKIAPWFSVIFLSVSWTAASLPIINLSVSSVAADLDRAEIKYEAPPPINGAGFYQVNGGSDPKDYQFSLRTAGSVFQETATIKYKANQAYTWIIFIPKAFSKNDIIWREETTSPAPSSWPTKVPGWSGVKVSNGGRTGTTEANGKNLSGEFAYAVDDTNSFAIQRMVVIGDGDPKGKYITKIFANDALVKTFEYSIVD